jgi:outer membrane protein
MKLQILRKTLALVLACFCSLSAISDIKNNEYVDYPEYDDGEGKLMIKFKLSGISSKSKGSGLPNTNPITGQPVNIGYNLVANGFGGETSTTVFFNENFASELSLGFHAYKTKQSVLNSVATNYGSNPNINKKLDIYSIPITLAFQYHIAPYGGLSPYFGAGYSLSYFYTNNKTIKINNIATAPVLQAGIDFISQDNTLFSLDIKQYFLRRDVTYKASALYPGTNANSLKSKLKLNPLVISAGIGRQF